jgi:hypothetical protein
MAEYDFQTLSSFDFQVLSRDLLQKKLNIFLESFGLGRDGGVDYRLRNSDGTIVVQCKHYSDYTQLFGVLKRDEVKKVQKLGPSRYILVVSTSLMPARKDQISELFRPYCHGPSDIFGREDLNNLLGLFPEIERKNVKLWLTSTAVLEKFINSAVWGDSELTLQRLRRRACRYVPNPSLDRARKILDRHHYGIIAGIPGIGKTTLAEILLIEHVDKHDYQAVRIANDLSEIKGVKNPSRRQIFYFDDFLGKTALDKLQKNEDQRLIEFIEEVKINDNWRFILTTREYILNAAKTRYESFAQPMVDLTPCIIEMGDYTEPIRAKILYNHIYFSDLPDDYKRELLEDRRYVKIVGHQNYNPRIVEHMTLAKNVKGISPTSYFEFFLENLANPVRIWDHAFKNQISEAGRHLLLVMGTLGSEVRYCDLETAFQSFYSFRQKKLGFSTTSRDFENAVRELDGNFIKTSLIAQDRIVTLHNPSLSDFLESYFAGNPADLYDLCQSAYFFDQYVELWRGRRGKRYAAFDGSGGGMFLRNLVSGLEKPTCAFVRFKGSSGDYLGVRIRNVSYERRAAFLLEVAELVATEEAREFEGQATRELRSRLEMRAVIKDDLVPLLKTIVTSRVSQSDRNGVIAVAKTFLLEVGEGSELDDFDAIARFAKAFPDILSDGELAAVAAIFVEYCGNYDESWADSPDDLRVVADDFERIAGILDADVGHSCDMLRRRADEWEGEIIAESQGPEEDDDKGWGRSERSDEGMNEMFEGLLEELNERDGDA